MHGMPGYIIWICMYGYCRENSGEIRRFRPSKPASPRRDLQKQTQTHTRALAQAESSRF